MVPSRQLFIGGSWVAPAKGGRIPIINPATEESIGASLLDMTSHVFFAALGSPPSAEKACIEASRAWRESSSSRRQEIRRVSHGAFFTWPVVCGSCQAHPTPRLILKRGCHDTVLTRASMAGELIYVARRLSVSPFLPLPAGTIPSATLEDVDAAVSAAREAYTRNGGKDWSRATGAHRAKYLRAIAAKVQRRVEDKLAGLTWCARSFMVLPQEVMLQLSKAVSIDGWLQAGETPNSRLFVPLFLQIAAQKETLAKYESMDNGKPLDEALWDMVSCF